MMKEYITCRYYSACSIGLALLMCARDACARTGGEGLSLGGVADNLLAVERSAGSFISFICFVAGAGMCFASMGLFYSHWKNPGNVRLSKPISMVVLGLALIVLSFIPMAA